MVAMLPCCMGSSQQGCWRRLCPAGPGRFGLEQAAVRRWICFAIEWADIRTRGYCDKTNTVLSPGFQAAAGKVEFFADNTQSVTE